MPVTLEQLLQSRDARAQYQKDLLGRFPGKSLLCLTVQLPGPEKRNALSLKIAEAGVEAVTDAFSIEYQEIKDLETGFEGYFLVQLDPLVAKRLSCQIEDTHPLGRLMDLDIVVAVENDDRPTAEETPTRILGREDIGLEPRRCLLCDQTARYCMRARTHTVADLLDRIGEMVKSYK